MLAKGKKKTALKFYEIKPGVEMDDLKHPIQSKIHNEEWEYFKAKLKQSTNQWLMLQ